MAGGIVRPSIDCRLRLCIVQLGGRAHQNAMKAVRTFATVVSDHHPHCERATWLARHQRTEIVGDAFRQHRYDAIREVN